MSRRYRLTIEVSDEISDDAVERVEAYLLAAADGLRGRLTVSEYADHGGDHRMEIRNRTLRKLGGRAA